ncbi:thiol:disulfide interchange protein DsbA/DsbL [Volucribacter amazonae]|uniref:Thiol:disulfide interchange protein DsbA n=1 Tax=Volucribacter amazonae TaxID=256731 RepID=A0A9X4SL05_9PAST|nr:thiol:disulfide interchange protein DsbA/DsbL [Volucribacter amazonae]MDG6895649.1 hypothetical protein [Volucribacter amazonae]
MARLFFLILLGWSACIYAETQTIVEKNIPQFEDGKDYFSYRVPISLEKQQDNKILIQSFFAYDCRICSQSQDVLTLYSQLHPHIIVLQKQPVATEQAKFSSNVYFALLALDREDLADLLLFDSATNPALTDIETLLTWVAENGIPDQQFLEFLQLPEIQQKSEEAVYLTEKYGVFTIPFVVIDGRYVLTQSTLYDDDYAFAVLDFLVDKVRTERQQYGTFTLK